MKNLIKYGFIAVVMLSFTSCTDVEVYEIEWAKKTCKDNKGVNSIKVQGLYVGCRCNDGHFEWKK